MLGAHPKVYIIATDYTIYKTATELYTQKLNQICVCLKENKKQT